MFEAAGSALLQIAAIEVLGYMLIGVATGLLVGVLPGLGGTAGMAVMIPFIYGMDPVSGLAMLMGMAAVIHTSDTFPSVLLGIPGSSGSQATIMDGYPLARQGQATRALAAAFFASMAGGITGAVVLFGTLSVARPLVLALRSPELFMLALLGLSLVGVLARGQALAGVLSAVLGVLLGTVGAAAGAPGYRYTFGSTYLWDGIPLPVLALGLFAVPEILELAAKKTAIAQVKSSSSRRLTGLRDVVQHRWLVARSSVLGTLLGIVPGIGGSVTDWITYGVARQTSKDERFGKGDIRGVIAPESANNAKEGGSLVPTLLFGIPGSGTTAMLLGALIMLGIQVGPTMVTTQLDVTLTIVWTLVIANIVGALACLSMSGVVARISFVPGVWLLPFLGVVLVFASFQATRHWGDIITFVAIGALGVVFKLLDWPRAPLLVGFVLAEGAERYLFRSISRYGLEWLRFPVVLILAALVVVVVASGAWQSARYRKRSSTVRVEN